MKWRPVRVVARPASDVEALSTRTSIWLNYHGRDRIAAAQRHDLGLNNDFPAEIVRSADIGRFYDREFPPQRAAVFVGPFGDRTRRTQQAKLALGYPSPILELVVELQELGDAGAQRRQLVLDQAHFTTPVQR